MMTQDQLADWAVLNGFVERDGYLSLSKDESPDTPSARIVFGDRNVSIEITSERGWKRIGGARYSHLEADPSGGPPSGLELLAKGYVARLMARNAERTQHAAAAPRGP